MMFTASLLLGLIVITGCNKKAKDNTGDDTEQTTGERGGGFMVPGDAMFVISADLNSMWDKGNFDNIDKISTVQYLRQEIKEEDPGAAKILDELLQDPNSCGLKLKGEAVAFKTRSLHSKYVVGLEVLKADKFEVFLKKISDKLGFDIDISKKDDIFYALCRDFDIAVCWNNSRAYIMANVYQAKDIEKDAQSLMSLSSQNSIANNEDYNLFMKDHRDVCIFANNSQLISYLSLREPSLYKQMKKSIDAYKNAYSCASLNFETGAIKMESKYLGLDANTNPRKGDFDSKLLDYLPRETFGAITIALNPDILLEELDKTEQVDLDETITRNGPTIRNLIQALSGNLAINLSDIRVDRYEEDIEPIISIAAGISNSRTIEKTFAALEEDGLEKEGNAYVIPGTNFTIKLTDNVLLFSNDQIALNAFDRGGAGNGMAQVASDAKNGNYMYLNLDLDDYPMAVKRMLDRRVVDGLSGFLKDAEIKTTEDYCTEATINLKNNSMNSLEFIINYIDTYISLQRILS